MQTCPDYLPPLRERGRIAPVETSVPASTVQFAVPAGAPDPGSLLGPDGGLLPGVPNRGWTMTPCSRPSP